MQDLAFATLLLLLLSIAAHYSGRQLGTKKRGANFFLLAAVFLTVAYAITLHGSLAIARLLPFSNVIVLGNAFPMLAAFMAGVVQSHADIPAWRRLALALSLIVVGWLTVVWNVILRDVATRNRFNSTGVCLQSTPVTCSACAGVTLLGRYGISSNETEMAKLCLTSGRGTTLQGLYRGLKLKTQDTSYDVDIVQCSFDDLQNKFEIPMIIPVKQEFSSGIEPVGPDSSWFIFLYRILGRTDHCVVLLGFTESEKALIADPSNSLTNPSEQPIESLQRNWLGVGFRLIQRSRD